MATLKDIAEEVGVSVTAASLVLNNTNTSSRVSEETALRIRKKAQELGYRPNAAAQRLAKRQSGLVGVVGQDLSYPVIWRRLEKTIACLLANDYEPLVWTAGSEVSAWDHTFDVLVTNNVTGVIILGGTSFDRAQQMVQQLTDAQIPTVSLDAGDYLPGAGVDRRRAFYEMTRIAIAAGHEKIGYLDYGGAGTRTQGVKEAVAECHEDLILVRFNALGKEPSSISLLEDERERGLAAGQIGAELFLEQKEPPSAMICHCDEIAIAFMHAIQRHGVSIPDDVAVFGFDGLVLSAYSYPPLTTMVQPIEKVALETFARLRDLMNNLDQASKEYKLFSAHLTARESSGPIPPDYELKHATKMPESQISERNV